MGKQAGNIKLERTLGRLVFYKMDGEYYVRTKSSLTAKRVKKDPRFRLTMVNAGLMGRASKIGSVVYKALPVEFRKFWMYRSFTGEALKMLKGGMMEEEVREKLMELYVNRESKNEKTKSEIKINKEASLRIDKSNIPYLIFCSGLNIKTGFCAALKPMPQSQYVISLHSRSAYSGCFEPDQ